MSKTRFLHIRNETLTGFDTFIDPRGGMTVMMQQGTPGTVVVSLAECSLKDNYCRRIGRATAEQKLAEVVTIDELPTYIAKSVEDSPRLPYANIHDFGFTKNYFQ